MKDAAARVRSKRNREISRLVRTGLSYAEIGDRLFMTEVSVKNAHMRRAKRLQALLFEREQFRIRKAKERFEEKRGAKTKEALADLEFRFGVRKIRNKVYVLFDRGDSNLEGLARRDRIRVLAERSGLEWQGMNSSGMSWPVKGVHPNRIWHAEFTEGGPAA